MNKKIPDMICFSSINILEPTLNKKSVKTKIILNKLEGTKNEFILRIKYDEVISKDLLPIFRLAFCMPLLNYGLFSKELKLQFPISQADLKLLDKLNNVFSKDIFVNKILRRQTNYILPKFLPEEKNVKINDASPKAKIKPTKIYKDIFISKDMNENNCGVLSSGGKESLLTYGLLKEIGCNVYPLYVNESGGHWRTALTAYNYHKKNDVNTQKIWTNVDRFYVFMLDNLRFIRSDHRKLWADTYPIRLCVFPFYVFSLLPIFTGKKIGNLLIGSEFDDLRIKPHYLGIPHYFGVYDQHQDHDILMNSWYKKRLYGLYQWSAVRNISGLIVERILTKRYPELASLQRSCHSCHFENKKIIPCGVCSKCMGVILFLLANKVNPKIMKFKKENIKLFLKNINLNSLRLDEDEKNHSLYLIGKKDKISCVKPIEHVEKIHINQDTCDFNLIPDNFKQNLLNIIKCYTSGFCELKNDNWISLKKV